MTRRRKHHDCEPDVVIVENTVVVEAPDERPVSVNPLDYLPSDVELPDAPAEVPAESEPQAPVAEEEEDTEEVGYEVNPDGTISFEAEDDDHAAEIAAAILGSQYEVIPVDEDEDEPEAPAEDEPVADVAPVAEAPVEEVPVEVPADVPGQPSTIYPDGEVPAEDLTDYPATDETPPEPSPGMEPVVPDEESK